MERSETGKGVTRRRFLVGAPCVALAVAVGLAVRDAVVVADGWVLRADEAPGRVAGGDGR